VLPVTENIEIPSHLGLRHRDAIGVTEQSDEMHIVVSEATGEISIGEKCELFKGHQFNKVNCSR
jgi:DNA integrity scanning protein DisA with diadenylate cyclase activity